MAHYDQNQKEVRTGDQGSQHRPLRGLRDTRTKTPDRVIGFVGMLS
jgi:hypothetical protein